MLHVSTERLGAEKSVVLTLGGSFRVDDWTLGVVDVVLGFGSPVGTDVQVCHRNYYVMINLYASIMLWSTYMHPFKQSKQYQVKIKNIV